VAICNAIAEGLMQPWMPVSTSAHKIASTTELPPSPTDKSQKRAAGKQSHPVVKQVKPKVTMFSFSPEALPHLKAALEVVCFYRCDQSVQKTKAEAVSYFAVRCKEKTSPIYILL